MRLTSFPPAMRELVNELTKLPSIGERSAVRLAYHLLMKNPKGASQLAESIKKAVDKTRLCEVCFGLTEEPTCSICQDPGREQSTICAVEKPADVLAIERSGGYRGLYHVLHGLWSPLRGVNIEQTKIGSLVDRIKITNSNRNHDDTKGPVQELILSTSTTVEGDATALYIANCVSELGIRVTRIAQGLPKGGELEYADEVTLSHALVGRRPV